MSFESSRSGTWRSRWAAVGAAVAVTAGAGGLVAVSAEDPPSAFVAIAPVRVLDTRDGNDVGLAGPFTSPAAQDLDVTGMIETTSGTQIVVPDGATGVALNVTVVDPSADGFLSVRPADAPGTPTTSNLNFSAGDVTPNAVTVALPTVGDDAGRIEISYDAYGQVGPATNVLVDVVGYYVPESQQPVWEGIPSGTTVVGNHFFGQTSVVGNVFTGSIAVPGVAIVPLATATANFATDVHAQTTDDDALCTGSYDAPTAPLGRFCAYVGIVSALTGVNVFANDGLVAFIATASGVSPALSFTWAYTAP
jgi:hypothetical protein